MMYVSVKGAMVQPCTPGQQARANQQYQQQKSTVKHQQHAGCLHKELTARDRVFHLLGVLTR